MKLFLASFFVIASFLAKSQVIDRYVCDDNYCDLSPEFSSQFYYGYSPERDDDHVNSFVVINDEYLYAPAYDIGDGEIKRYVNSIQNSLEGSELDTDGDNYKSFCIPAKTSKSSISFYVHTTTNDNGGPLVVNDFRNPKGLPDFFTVYDITDINNKFLYSNRNEFSVEGDNSEKNYSKHTWKGYLLPGRIYEFNFPFSVVRTPNGESTRTETATNRLYVCVRGESPIVSEGVIQASCKERLLINNFYPNLTYEYAETVGLDGELTFRNDQRFSIEGGQMISPYLDDGNFYIRGVLYGDNDEVLYYTPIITKRVYETVNPDAPIYVGRQVYCICVDGENPLLNFQDPGANKSLVWYNNETNEIIDENTGVNEISYNNYSSFYQAGVSVAVRDDRTGCISDPVTLEDIELIDCDCDKKFAPSSGTKYIITGWVKEGNSNNAITYSGPTLKLNFLGANESSILIKASGEIVDGWQQIKAEVIIPADAVKMEIELLNEGTEQVWFDDIRFQPFNSSMVSYVYDQETFQLVAELDDENFKTEYIYDKDGNLIKTNVETIDGVRTVSESRSHIQVND